MILSFVNADMESEIVIHLGLGDADQMGKAHLPSGHSHTHLAELLCLSRNVMIPEQLLQQFVFRQFPAQTAPPIVS